MPSVPASKKGRTVPKTYRLPSDLIDEIQALADEEGTTANALVFSLLNRYVDWEAKGRKLGFFWISGPMLRILLDSTDEEKLARFARAELPRWWREMSLILYGDDSPQNMVRVATEVGKYSWVRAGSFTVDGSTHRWNFSHELGGKFSVLIGSALDELIWAILHTRPRVKLGDSMVSLTFVHQGKDWVP